MMWPTSSAISARRVRGDVWTIAFPKIGSDKIPGHELAAGWIKKIHGLGYKIMIGDPSGELTYPDIPEPQDCDQRNKFLRWKNDDFAPRPPDPADYGIYPEFVTMDYIAGLVINWAAQYCPLRRNINSSVTAKARLLRGLGIRLLVFQPSKRLGWQ